MAEVQAHGIDFEDLIITQRTGMSKKEYDKFKAKNGFGTGYTSKFDIAKGALSEVNTSVKSTNSNTICCGDLIHRIEQKDNYTMLVGVYNQVEDYKCFHTQYEFFIQTEDYEKLWGDMTYDSVISFVNYVKSIPEGPEGQEAAKLQTIKYKELVSDEKALFVINPKIDSKNQRRVQCSINLKKILSSEIKYTEIPIDVKIYSKKREYKK